MSFSHLHKSENIKLNNLKLSNLLSYINRKSSAGLLIYKKRLISSSLY